MSAHQPTGVWWGFSQHHHDEERDDFFVALCSHYIAWCIPPTSPFNKNKLKELTIDMAVTLPTALRQAAVTLNPIYVVSLDDRATTQVLLSSSTNSMTFTMVMCWITGWSKTCLAVNFPIRILDVSLGKTKHLVTDSAIIASCHVCHSKEDTQKVDMPG